MALQRHIATSVSLPPLMLADLKAEAARRDLSLSQLLRAYVRAGQLQGQQGQLDLLRTEGANDNGS